MAGINFAIHGGFFGLFTIFDKNKNKIQIFFSYFMLCDGYKFRYPWRVLGNFLLFPTKTKTKFRYFQLLEGELRHLK
jgi:hypothetical protein